jgi:pyruvate kinase
MKRVAGRIEEQRAKGYNAALPLKTNKDRLLRSAVVLAQELGDAGIVVFTRSGLLPAGALRPAGLAVPHLRLHRRPPGLPAHADLIWGVEPFLMEFKPDPEETIATRSPTSCARLGEAGDWMVVVTNVLAGEKTIDSIQMRPVE